MGNEAQNTAPLRSALLFGLVGILLYSLVALFYLPSLSYPPISLDDYGELQHLADQPLTVIWKYDRFGHLRPLKSLFFWSLARNLQNVSIYRIIILSTFCALLLLVQLLATRISQSRRTGLAVAICWALNPCTVTVICWFSAATNAFSLLGLLIYLSCGYDALTSKSSPNSVLWSIAAIVGFGAGLLSHELALGAPMLLFAAQRLFRWNAAGKKVTYFYLASGLCIAAFAALHLLNTEPPNVYRFKDTPAWLIAWSAARYMLHNTSLWLWPLRRFGVLLSDEPAAHLLTSGLSWAVMAAAVATSLYSLRKSGKYDAVVVFGFFWYALFLMPQSNFIPIGNTPIAIHYMFFPSVGLSIVLCRWAAGVIERINAYPERFSRYFGQVAAGGIACLILAVWLPESRRTVAAWGNAELLYGWTHANYPKAVEPLVNLSNVYLDQNRYDKAASLLEKAHRFAPDDIPAMRSLLSVYWKTGRLGEALKLLDQYPGLNRQPEFLVLRGEVLEQLRRYGEAVAAYRQAFEMLASQIDDENRFIAGYRLVVTYLYTDQAGPAKELVARLLQDYPDRKELLLARKLLMENGQTKSEKR